MLQDQKFKGAGFNAIVGVVRERFGEDAVRKIVEKCNPETRSYATRKVLDNEWVPDVVSAEFIEVADKVMGRGDESLMRWIGYQVAKENLSGIYKAFVKMSSIQSILKRANVVWKKYYSHGYLETIELEKGRFVFEVRQYDPTPSSCPSLLGWMDMFLEVYKKKGKAEHVECRLKGGKCCRFKLTWE